MMFIMALVMTALTTPPANAAEPANPGKCDEYGSYEVCVTYAGKGTPDNLIYQRIKGKLDATASSPGANDYIRVSMYEWDINSTYGKAIAGSLKTAHDNGVSVRVVLGGESVNDQAKAYFEGAGIDVEKCSGSCTEEPGGTNHNKFFLIKKGTTELVLQTSTNLTDSQGEHAQNLLVSRDDPELFSHYVNYWRRLYVNSWTWDGQTWNEADRARYGTNDLSRVYFYPMPEKQPLVGVLQNVTACAPGNDRVFVEASLFDKSEYSREIANELKRLHALGCDVRVILQKQSGVNTLTNPLLLEGYGFQGGVRCDGQHHNKLLLIDAQYAGEWRKAVFVGSYNITQNSLRSANDTMLRVVNGWVTNRYIDQFEKMWANPRACDAE